MYLFSSFIFGTANLLLTLSKNVIIILIVLSNGTNLKSQRDEIVIENKRTPKKEPQRGDILSIVSKNNMSLRWSWIFITDIKLAINILLLWSFKFSS